jgi:hypothetical protein
MFSMASLYIMMTLTYWFNIAEIAEANANNTPLSIAGTGEHIIYILQIESANKDFFLLLKFSK